MATSTKAKATKGKGAKQAPAPKDSKAEPVGFSAEGEPRFAEPHVLEKRSSFCDTARRIDAGTINSTVDPTGWRQLCPVTRYLPGGTLFRCSDEHHAHHNTCTWCGQGIDELGPDLRCIDVEACRERHRRAVEETPRFKRNRELDEAAKVLRAEEAARRPTDGEGRATERKPRGEPKPTSGVCHHCGEPTKGGRFVAGHDAKLKGILKRRAVDHGSAWAVAEAIARDWFKPGAWKGLDPQVLADGQAVVELTPTHLVIEGATKARLQQVQAGEDPEHATGQGELIEQTIAEMANPAVA